MTLMCLGHLENRLALQGSYWSLQQIHDALLRIEYVILENAKIEQHRTIPIRIGNHAKSLYRTMDLVWNVSTLALN